jgi:methyl-accepting chemotaxis protein
MNLGVKIGGGFSVVILISIIIGGVAMISMKGGETTAIILSEEYVPEVAMANSIERGTFLMLLEMRDYGYTYDENSLITATSHLADVKQQIKTTATHGSLSTRLAKLKESAGKAEQSILEYEVLIEKTVRLTKELERQRKAAENAGNQYLKAGYAFLESQKEAMAGEIMAGLEGDALDKRLNRISLVTEIINLGNRIDTEVWKAQFKRDPKLLLETIVMLDNANEKLDALKRICDFEGDLKRIEDCRTAAIAYKSASGQLAEAWKAREEITKKQLILADGVAEQAKHFAAVGMADVTQGAERTAQSLSQASKVVGIGIVLGLILSIVVAVMIIRGITRPILSAVQMLKDIAQGEGDLTMRLDAQSKDEVGELAFWFNTFIEKLQGIVKRIAENSNMVNASSDQLSSIAKELSSGAEDTSQRAANVATASEEMSANLNNVAAAMEQSSTNTNIVASAAEEMTTTINEIAENAERARNVSSKAVDQAKIASNKMGELGEAAKKIGMVTETITEISEQTNLLALNATIEAARAGEAGKGFAVVANEIKNLARQTAQATMNIKNQINDVQRTTEASITEINQISTVISGVNDIVTTIAAAVEEQTAATREIATNIAQASRGIQEVNENVSQSSTVAGDITEDICKVNLAATGISNSSNQVQASSEGLQRMASELNTIVGSFKV